MTDKELPHPDDVELAYRWLCEGAPPIFFHGYHRKRVDVRKLVRILMDVMEVLPQLHPIYYYGTEENDRAVEERRQKLCAISSCTRVLPNKQCNIWIDERRMCFGGNYDLEAASCTDDL